MNFMCRQAFNVSLISLFVYMKDQFLLAILATFYCNTCTLVL